ncbi:MAG: LLM class flavin-dependent oxidoreductase [Actinobacteria bacterium]|nr:LLM class flavin-dependent oxidoreductase [Actinomycetota bacterium]
MSEPLELAWFAALCDDDYELLGVPDPTRVSSFEHCSAIVHAADRAGYDAILMPSGYALGIDTVAFTAAIARSTTSIRPIVAVRMGEMWPPQLARQLATLDHLLDGRMVINIISSELPGESLAGGPRYARTREYMHALRTLLDGRPLHADGDWVSLDLDPPRVRTTTGTCPPLYFGGLSDEARDVAAEAADVYLMWPDTIDGVRAIVDDMRARAAARGRALRFGYRVHVVVRPTEAEARAAARHLVSALDPEVGDAIRARSLDSQSVGVRAQASLRDAADDDGFVEPHLWTGIGRARSGCGAAIVGDPQQVAAKIRQYRDLGIDTFILSGYPHLEECERFASLVMPQLRDA